MESRGDTMTMMDSWLLGTLLCLASLSLASSYSPLRDRVAVVHGKLYEAFLNNASSKFLTRATSADGHTWSWQSTSISSQPLSNPSAVYALNSTRPIQVAFLTGVINSTEPYLWYGNDTGNLQAEKIGASLPADLPVAEWSPDSVVMKILHKDTFVFARSQSKQSHVYWTYRPEKGQWSPWKIIGDSSYHVKSDPAVAINTYLNRFEVFVLLDEGTLVHAWQTDKYSFSDWHGGIGDFPPTFDSTPAVHEMTHADFNGMLQVFVRGTDKFIHHISQTTCDKVNNPWGPCTWGIRFTKLGDRMAPGSHSAPNPLTIGVTIHGGLEVFLLDDDANLWYIYQLERGGSWREWIKLGPLDEKNAYGTIPSIFNDDSGWWNALSVGSGDNMLHTYTQPRSISADKSITYASNLTVKWSVPVDDAARTDWLGIYPQEAAGDGYVDFRYVGGNQNPTGDPVHSGKLPFSLFLPDDTYEVRYVTEMKEPAIMQTTFVTSNRTYEPEWVQLYKGIALGLGNMSTDYINCVEDGNRTIETFEDAFKAFRDRNIIEGLHLFAQGLSDVSDAIIDCGETPISQDLLDFIRDLISCESTADCVHFVIDLADIILIFYENEYEIYGDILAADNCFKLEAYEQGGLSIGRVTYACLTLRLNAPHNSL